MDKMNEVANEVKANAVKTTITESDILVIDLQ